MNSIYTKPKTEGAHGSKGFSWIYFFYWTGFIWWMCPESRHKTKLKLTVISLFLHFPWLFYNCDLVRSSVCGIPASLVTGQTLEVESVLGRDVKPSERGSDPDWIWTRTCLSGMTRGRRRSKCVLTRGVSAKHLSPLNTEVSCFYHGFGTKGMRGLLK